MPALDARHPLVLPLLVVVVLVLLGIVRDERPCRVWEDALLLPRVDEVAQLLDVGDGASAAASALHLHEA